MALSSTPTRGRIPSGWSARQRQKQICTKILDFKEGFGKKKRKSTQIDPGKYMTTWSGLCWAKGESSQAGRKVLRAPALAKRYLGHNLLRTLLDMFTNQVVMVIPSSLGYGDRGAGGVIPGGATLYFITTLQVDFEFCQCPKFSKSISFLPGNCESY